MELECIVCCNDINEEHKVITEEHKIYEYCLTCVQYIKNTKINKYIEDFKKEDCLASIKRMIKKGIPYKVDDLNLFYKNENISYLTTDENIQKIKNLNKELINLELEDDFIKEEALKIILQILL